MEQTQSTQEKHDIATLPDNSGVEILNEGMNFSATKSDFSWDELLDNWI